MHGKEKHENREFNLLVSKTKYFPLLNWSSQIENAAETKKMSHFLLLSVMSGGCFYWLHGYWLFFISISSISISYMKGHRFFFIAKNSHFTCDMKGLAATGLTETFEYKSCILY